MNIATMDTAELDAETMVHRRLVAAVLIRGLRDYNGVCGDIRVQRASDRMVLVNQAIRAAQCWVEASDTTEMSFIYCCEELDLDPNVIRRRMAEGTVIPEATLYAKKGPDVRTTGIPAMPASGAARRLRLQGEKCA